MKKNVRFLPAVLSVCMLLSACGGKPASDTPASTETAAETTAEITTEETTTAEETTTEETTTDETTTTEETTTEETTTTEEVTELVLDEEIPETNPEDFETLYDAALGGAYITGYNGSDSTVRFPAEIDGDKIIGIVIGYDFTTGIHSGSNYTIDNAIIPEGITHVFFRGCSGIETVVLPDSVTEIPEEAFRECKRLKSINLSNVTSVGDYAFFECKSLNNVDISNVTYFAGSSFKRCFSMEEIHFSDNVTFIGDGAFKDCDSLTEVEVPYNGIGQGETFAYCDSLKKATVNCSTSTSMFKGCTQLEEVVFTQPDDGNTYYPIIQADCFTDCTSLKSVDISGFNRLSLDYHSFKNCSKLRSLDLSNMEQVEFKDGPASAFADCNALTVTYKGNEYNYTNFNDIK